MNVWRRVCGLAVILSLFAAVGVAQDKKHEAQLRTVRGVVADKSDSPLSGSVVFLKNVRTNSVRSSYTDDTGNYRFSGLDPNADYELHAEKEGAKSPTRTVSSFDSRKDTKSLIVGRVRNLSWDLALWKRGHPLCCCNASPPGDNWSYLWSTKMGCSVLWCFQFWSD